MAKKKLAQIKITQTRSIIDRPRNQRLTIEALGLHRIRHSVVHEATPQILGMVNRVRHMVTVEEVK